ncbi:site-specific integrase [Mangrovimonas sp. AS39]|uniref:tyrosine-type recombinase/integrase n=1 Tax=Mangrovimonas futianensis TaxID=2895523 RepID=UPI001E2EBE1A|nr:phage integrase SAM-like domain-containing protein [Mangrovimonas futianensis]MCF1192963.1 site-specific integrase [Mangrovimonas futianensis]MCF1196654.1 site-specific integrase [Mangrovimonas futianensis]MCF1421571.1 site-specific integrase [Mangrovimonas futianensis]
MASINFLYRSTKDYAPLNLRLLFRINNQDKVIGTKTKLVVSKNYWKKHNLKRLKDIDILNERKKVNDELDKIESFLLKKFHNSNPNLIDKKWLNNQLEAYYQEENDFIEEPTDGLVEYFEDFLRIKGKEISDSSIKKYTTVKNLVIKFDNYTQRKTKINEVNLAFKDNFEDFCLNNHYSSNTIAKALRTIKTVCNHAKLNGHSISHQIDAIKPKYLKPDHIYLNEKEITSIESIDENKLTESLTNARDWLLISCYCGQRVSDFMRFDKSMIRFEKNKPLIEFTQKKTGKIMTIPVHQKIMKILSRRDGNFPRPISDQKYNKYIKDLCALAKINQIIKGSKKQETKKDSKIYRKISGEFPKYELVSSHIGRRSFATNHYGIIPTTFLMYITGHSTEAMFLKYIGKSNKDLALEISKFF